MKSLFNKIFIPKQTLYEFIIKRTVILILLLYGIGLVLLAYNKYFLFISLFIYISIFYIGYLVLIIGINIKRLAVKENIQDLLVLTIIALFCILNSFYFSELLIEGGHDQGTYLESAILLAKNGTLYANIKDYPFIYSFPGWDLYQETFAKHTFLPGNAFYLSIFYRLFQFKGIEVANSFLLFLSTSVIYFLIKKFNSWKTGAIWVLFFLFNYYTLYFSRATYVENLQLLFIWSYIYLFISGVISKKINDILYSFFPLILLATVRQEGFLYIPMYFILLIYLIKFEKISIKKQIPLLLLNFFVLFIIYASLFKIDNNFLSTAFNFIAANKVSANIAHNNQGEIPYNQQLFIFANLFYMFTAFYTFLFLLGTAGIFKERILTRKVLIIIFLLIIPQFLFFIRPGIAFYLPWLMRRFWAVFIPFSLIIIVSYLNNNFFLYKKSYTFHIFVVTVVFLILSLPGLSILMKKNGSGILAFEKAISSSFKKDDLIIFWDRYAHENWGPPLFFLHSTNVLYDRLPAHKEEYYALLMKRYNNVYIATSRESVENIDHPYFAASLMYYKTITSIPTLSISGTCDTRGFIIKPQTFNSYSDLADICETNNPPIEHGYYQIKIILYKLNESYKNDFVKKHYNPTFKFDKKTSE